MPSSERVTDDVTDKENVSFAKHLTSLAKKAVEKTSVKDLKDARKSPDITYLR